MVQIPKFEALEDRIVLDGVPEVTIDAPASIEIGAQDVPVTLTFDNTGTDSGYAPYVDLVIPSTGSDGDDGVTFDSATFLGASIVTTEIVFDAQGEAVHPYATDTNGDPLVISATDFSAQPGDTLVVFQLPYGSFSPGNPPVDIDVVLDFSENADLSDDFNLRALGGFSLGEDALDNPGTDAPIRGAITTDTVEQTLFEVTKASNVPEEEAATGPSYPYQYSLTVDVADNQSLDNFTLTDTLPTNIVYLGGLTINGGTGGTVTTEPAVGAQVTGATNQLVVDFTNVSDTVTVTFDYYITQADGGTPVLNPTTGLGDVTNTVTGEGDWDPIDPRDATQTDVSDSDSLTTTASALNVQKSQALPVDTGPSGPTPGDEYVFTLNVQVADYSAIGELELVDELSNGWDYVEGSATFTTVEQGQSITTAQGFDETASGDLDVDLSQFNTTGETTLTFDLSQAMVTAGQDGLLVGDIARDTSSEGIQTTVQITYRATIRDTFTNSGGLGQPQIGQGDSLSNEVTITGDIRDPANLNTSSGNQISNDSETTTSLQVGSIREKTVAAINGQPPGANPIIAAGDTITFSIIYDAPLGSFDDLRIVDNLPQNLFNATEMGTFYAPGTGPAIPPAGQSTFGPSDTYFSKFQTSGQAGTGIPTISTDAADNQIDYDIGPLNLSPREPVVLEILLTVTVQDAIFAPDLFLTNQSTAFENNVAVPGEVDTTAIAQFNYAEPELNITKGVVAFSPSPNSDVTLGDTGPVTFNAPGTTGPRFSGTVNSTNLQNDPIDADIDGIDAGDTLTYAIVVENTGRAPNGAFDVTIQDSLPAGLSLVPGSVFVTDGTGAAINFTGDLFAGGLTLTDPPPAGGLSEGAISSFDTSAGDNIAIVTYDVTVENTTTPGESYTNTSEVTEFAAAEGGVDRVPAGRLSDTASATVQGVEIEKALKTRQFTTSGDIANGGAAGRNSNEVVVGEDVEFTIRIDLPEARYFDAQIRDRVNVGGLVLESATIDTSPIAGQAGTNATLNNGQIIFNLGDFTNTADNDLTNDFIEVTVRGRIDDVAGFDAGDLIRNTASFSYAATDGGSTITERDNQNLRLTEPNLTLDKESTDADDIVNVGDTVTYEIDIANLRRSRDAPAFDLTLTDTLPAAFMTLDPGSIQLQIDGSTVAFNGTDFALNNTTPANGFTLFIDRLDPNQTAKVIYTADVIQTVPAGTNIDNTANLSFDSTPEDDSAGPDLDDREYSLSDTERVQVASPQIDKSVVDGSTSYPETSGSDLGIGELVTYEIVATIPEGTVDGVILRDTLPEGMEFVSANLVRFGDTGGNLVDEVGPLPTGTHNAATRVTTFDFGDLTNTFDGVQNSEDEIVVRVTARLTADAGVDTSDTLTNTGAIQFDDGQGNTQIATDTADVEVVEPDVDIAKIVSPATADAGDIVNYRLISSNNGDGPAYDMVINDDVVGSLVTLDPATVAITIRDAGGGVVSTVPAGTPVLGAAVENTLGFRVGGAGALQVVVPVLQAGHTVEITYGAEVQDGALFSTAYTNTAEVTRYDSNPAGSEVTDPGAPEEERVYEAGLAGYTVPEATATFTTLDASLTKNYLSSSDANTANATGAANAQLVVGETVTYELIIDIPEGTANLVLNDDLPPGLQPVSAQVVNMNGAVSANGLTNGTTDSNANITLNASSGGTVEFDFGSTTLAGTTPSNPAGSQIVVQITAEVLDVVPAVANGQTLTNIATLDVTNPAGGANLQDPVIASESVDIVEPLVDIEKTGPIGADPGDTVPYSITVTNTGTGPAYDMEISDPLADPDLSLVGTPTATDGDGNPVPAGQITTGAFAGDGFRITGLTLLPGQSATVNFNVLLDANADQAESFINTATAIFDTVEDDNPNTGGRTGTVSDDHRLATIPFIFKEPFSSSNPDTNSDAPTDRPFDLAVGEEVTYRYQITLPELPGQTVSITDDLPAGFRFVEAAVDLTGSQLSGSNLSSATGLTVGTNANGPTISLAGNDVTFDFGAVANPVNNVIDAGDSFFLLVTAVVEDNPANTAGAERTNTVTLDVDPDGPGGNAAFNQQEATADVRIVEPELDIEKTGPIALSPGASGTFTITATNGEPNVTPAADGPAYDVDISDSLPAGMTLDATAFTVQIDGATTAFTETRNTGGDGFTISVPRLLPDQVLTISYTASLDANAAPLTEFTNTATANYDSAPGNPVDSQGNPITDRDATPVSDTHTVSSGPTLDKMVTGTSNALTGAGQFDAFEDLAIGEEATYQMVITLPDISMDSVQLVDALPAGMDFVSARVVSTSNDVAINGATTITPAGQNVTFAFTDVVNDTSGTDQNQIVVEVVARVNAATANVNDADLTNTATLTITPQGEAALTPVTDTATVEVVEPTLTIDKTSEVAVNPGDSIDYQLVIDNTGSAPAYDVIIADPISNPFLTLDTGSVTVTLTDGGTTTTLTGDLNIVESGGGFTVELDDVNTGQAIPIPVGARVTVDYSATLSATAPEAESFPNTATINYDGLPGDPVDGNGTPIPDRDYTANDTASVATVPFLTKTPTASSFAETGETPFELNIGEEVTFTYELFLPEVGLERVTFLDDLPDGMDYVGFSVVSTGGITASGGGPVPAPTETVVGNNVELVWTDLLNDPPNGIDANDKITITVTGRVNDQFTAGTDLVNNAVLEVDPVGAPALNQRTATSTVGIVEPDLTVTKTGPQGGNPGSTIPYSIVVENTHPSGNTGPAYDVSIVDTLPAGIALNPGTLTFTSDQRGILTPSSLTATVGGFDADFPVLLAGEVLTITYDGTLSATIPAAESVRNEVAVNYDSAPGNDPNQKVYAEETDDHRISTVPGLEKVIAATDISQTGTAAHDPNIDDVSVGELITYQLTLTLPELDDQRVVLSDTLPAGLEFVSSRVASVGAEITGITQGSTTAAGVAGQIITFTFADVDNTFAQGQADEGVINDEDRVVIEVVARVADVAAASDGAQLTNDARLNVRTSDGVDFTEQRDDVTVEVVEPQIDIEKSVSEPNPTVGDTITYTVVLTNDAAATGPAFNLVIQDALPTDLSVVGTPRLSDPSLGNVLSNPGATTLVVGAPVLLPGQTLTVEYDVFVGFRSPVLQEIENTATVTGSTTPFGPGRPQNDQDTAIIEADPAPAPVFNEEGDFAGGGIDDARFLPVLLIDPIFSGTAEPGANVTVSLYRQDGALSYVRNILADAGGHWIALFPRVQVEQVEDDFWSFYDRSVLFQAPVETLDRADRDFFGRTAPERSVTIGTILNDEGYSISLQQDRPSTLPEDLGLFNARTFFSPAVVGEGYGTNTVLKVDEVFTDTAALTVERLYQSSVDPLGLSLNRFNYEFLSEATALPGSAR
ncbi:isopeptide-forming domain-containing fimbrial protein [Actibacterium sp. 188UL27-1]|uniref:isopeptide-forming domain-containing fimbrial protein n=1 Tax=Actibacterium sp. 188UL27-1 TaxID=2786961 RepID=UPI001957B4B6|nr:isopeptide-forming domain-containing fimbrial protein [Actibacterium sp. 188UL27-1]MBM7069429.1 isopeptide-forming domain-containing fimbrial protein [Actibacterium sp. 188UL27-1]